MKVTVTVESAVHGSATFWAEAPDGNAAAVAELLLDDLTPRIMRAYNITFGQPQAAPLPDQGCNHDHTPEPAPAAD